MPLFSHICKKQVFSLCDSFCNLGGGGGGGGGGVLNIGLL